MRHLQGKERTLSTGPLRYRLIGSDEGRGGSESFPHEGIVLNASGEGMCFITPRPLEKGQTIVILCPWLMDGSEEVTVTWCRKVAIDLWRIDVQRE